MQAATAPGRATRHHARSWIGNYCAFAARLTVVIKVAELVDSGGALHWAKAGSLM
jgi:hypothetical protein